MEENDIEIDRGAAERDGGKHWKYEVGSSEAPTLEKNVEKMARDRQSLHSMFAEIYGERQRPQRSSEITKITIGKMKM